MEIINTMKYWIKTFGCQMNFHDSEHMAGLLRAQGFTEAPGHREADLIILNTCSIREKAEQKFLSELGRLKALKRRRPGLRIAVAGCVAQQMGQELLRRAPHVDYLVGPQNIGALKELLQGPRGTALEDNPHLAHQELPALRKSWPKAWVNIMFGCDNFCSYCIVPFTRGRQRCRPLRSILREVKELAQQGFKEITLLGQNVNSYKDEVDFPGLLRALSQVEGIERIRFVTSHPRDFSPELIRAMAELPQVCDHVHLPLQSGSDKVLRAMNRRYTYQDYKGKLLALREQVPSAAVTTDIITGFPGEQEEDHQATLRALQELQFDGAFCFKFSPRAGTKAAELKEQLPEELKAQRLKEILALQDEITFRKNQALVGRRLQVLVEGPSPDAPQALTGRTTTNKIVHFEGEPTLVGKLVEVKIKRALRHSLSGELVQ